MNFCIIMFIVIFCIQAIYTWYIFRFAEDHSTMLNLNINIPGTIADTAFNARMISYSLMLNDYPSYEKYKDSLEYNVYFLNDENIPSVSENMENIVTETPLLSPVGKYAFDTFETLNLADSYRKLITNLKFIINREMLKVDESITEILYEPHFRYFSINSSRNFDLVFNKCKQVLSEKILDKFLILEYVAVIFDFTLVFISFLIIYITFVPFRNSTNKITLNVFRMFKHIQKNSFEEIITDYEEKIETLRQNFDLDSNENLHNEKKDRSKKIKLTISFTIIFTFIILSALPVLITLKEIRDMLSLIDKSADRISILKNIQLYTYEVINQDKSLFLLNEPERILNDLVNRLETIQEELKSGSYGGPTFDKYPSLDYITKENGCHRMNHMTPCDEVVYDRSYGFSKDVATLPINELIREYIYEVKGFMYDINDNKYNRPQFTNRENIQIIFDQVQNDPFFKLQNGLMENMIGSIQVANNELIMFATTQLESSSEIMMYIIIAGVLILIIIDIFIFNDVYEDKIKEMNSLVSFVFLVPRNIVNKSDKYKKFLETTQTDE